MPPPEADPSFSSVLSTPPLDPESTAVLLSRARSGDADAMNRLLARCLPALRRWAHGRLPQYARDVNETEDVVHEAVVSTLKHIDRFQPRHEGALQAYLRTAVNRRIIDLIRQRRRRPDPADVPESLADDGTSPLDRAIGAENTDRYEAALQRLSEEDREAIVCRLEMHYTYDELAVALAKPTANAARVAVMRAVHRLAQELNKSASVAD
jgi:RNA polymerase sigma-70 factor, ECF subfamily